MARQQRHAPTEPSISENARTFLNAAHGYDNSNPDCNKRTQFATLVIAALNTGLVSKHDCLKTFGFTTEQFDKARKGHSTGIPSDNRAAFISFVTAKAERALEA